MPSANTVAVLTANKHRVHSASSLREEATWSFYIFELKQEPDTFVPNQFSCSAIHSIACHSEGPFLLYGPEESLRCLVPGRERTYYVYILTSSSGTLYTGMTNSMIHRFRQHKRKEHPGFTAQYDVNRLVYYET